MKSQLIFNFYHLVAQRDFQIWAFDRPIDYGVWEYNTKHQTQQHAIIMLPLPELLKSHQTIPHSVCSLMITTDRTITHTAVLYTVQRVRFASDVYQRSNCLLLYFSLLLYPSNYHWAIGGTVGASVGSHHCERRRRAKWPWWSWSIFFLFLISQEICKIIS